MIALWGVVLSSSVADGMSAEQAYLTTLYDRLDRLRDQADQRLRAILLEAGGTPQGRAQREATRSHYAEQLAQMNSVENGLCFGRLDFTDGMLSLTAGGDDEGRAEEQIGRAHV